MRRRRPAEAVTGSGVGVVVLGLAALGLVVATLLWPAEAGRRAWRLVDAVLACRSSCSSPWRCRAGGWPSAPSTRGSTRCSCCCRCSPPSSPGCVAARRGPCSPGRCSTSCPVGGSLPRLALLGGVRQPLRVAGTTAFLAATVCSVVFAGAYRSTLDEGAADRAVFETGLDARVVAGTSLESPLRVGLGGGLRGPDARGRRHVGGDERRPARVGECWTPPPSRSSASTHSLLPSIRRWDRVVGGGDPTTLADQIRTAAPPAGAVLPDGRTFSMAATGPLRDIAVSAWFRAADGREVGVPLLLSAWHARTSTRPESGVLSTAVPDLGGPVTLYRLVMRQPTDDATRRQHRLGEGSVDLPVVEGTMTFAEPVVDGTTVSGAWTGWGSPSGATTVEGSTLTVVVRLTGDLFVVGPGLGESRGHAAGLRRPGDGRAGRGRAARCR